MTNPSPFQPVADLGPCPARIRMLPGPHPAPSAEALAELAARMDAQAARNSA